MSTWPEPDFRALVVDDDDVDRERLVRMLHRGTRRIDVVEASSQAEALSVIRRPASHFDIVFLDFGLTDGDGRDLVPQIHDELDPDVPIVAVTGGGDEHVAAASIKSGMTEFLPKRSLTPERVAASIEDGIAWRQDRQDSRRAEEELTHRGLHDPLTDLPNRTLLFDRLGQACARARRSGDPFAVVLLDLDCFKAVNDGFGHAAGDAVLITLAQRLRRGLRETDTVSRLGGDEFAILLEGVGDAAVASMVAAKIVALVEQPIVHAGHLHHLGASLGLALCPQLGLSPLGLIEAADEAMFEAKRRAGDGGSGADGNHAFGGDGSVVISRPLASRPVPRAPVSTGACAALLAAFAEALERREVEWHWQPKVDLRDGHVLGFEALVRWHPRTGPVPIDELVSAIEGSDLVGPFTAHCLDTVLGQFAHMRDALEDVLDALPDICINVSARMIERGGFVATVVEAIERHGIDPARVVLELTETALIANPAQARRVIEQLHAQRIRLSIDDFGAGFTSFGYLRDFAVNEIKIDRAYIARLTESRFDQSLVTSLVVLCQSLGIPLVAEGIEDEHTREMLAAMGCSAGQGYGICRPMAFERVAEWLMQRREARLGEVA